MRSCLLTFFASLSVVASAASAPIVAVTDPSILKKIEGSGASLGRLLEGSDTKGVDNAALSKRPVYRSLAAAVSDDLIALAPIYHVARPPMKGPAHAFPARWLHSPDARFELVGILNRIDRRPFTPAKCGEYRFVYRLAYDTDAGGKRERSRLPMTVTLVYSIDGGCVDAARAWRAAGDIAAWLSSASSPIRAALELRVAPERVEINLQSGRWEPVFRPELGGQADYVLRSFRRDGKRRKLVPLPLENTPDVDRITASPALRRELLAWILRPDSLAAIDRGTAVLPEKFLSERALSVTPFGLARLGNRPFRRIFSPSDVAGAALDGLRSIRSPAALLRRLDGLSCVGCHQSRAVAGFHLLGEDATLVAPGSPHFAEELARRAAYVSAVAEGREPDERRPPAERAIEGPGGHGEACGLGDAGFLSWTCAPGLACRSLAATPKDDVVGECLPPDVAIGAPCEPVEIVSDGDPHRDDARRVKRVICAGEAICSPREVGFPAGMCVGRCDAAATGVACQRLPAVPLLAKCLAQGKAQRRCLEETAQPVGLPGCGASPCRSDYVCVAGLETGRPACVPPYFLTALTIDGHPKLR